MIGHEELRPGLSAVLSTMTGSETLRPPPTSAIAAHARPLQTRGRPEAGEGRGGKRGNFVRRTPRRADLAEFCGFGTQKASDAACGAAAPASARRRWARPARGCAGPWPWRSVMDRSPPLSDSPQLRAHAPAFKPKATQPLTNSQKRLQSDLRGECFLRLLIRLILSSELERNPLPLLSALPLESNINTWHLNVLGPGTHGSWPRGSL